MIDFLVIGGGIAGLSAGARLSAHGTVCVLEAEEALGYHASGRSAALFEPNYGNAAVKALNHAGETFFRDGNYLTPRGFLLLGSAGGDALFEQDLHDMACPEITVDAAIDMVPILRRDAIARAAFNTSAEDIDTDLLLQDFARTIRQNGGRVVTGARVTQMRQIAGGWAVSAQDTLEARVLVNAAGPWADEIAQMAGIAPLGLVPYRRSMARIAAPGGHDVSGWPMFFGAGETWYAKPDAGQLIVSPADAEPSVPMDAWPDDMVLAEGLARYQDHVTEEVTRPTATWAGLRTFAPDHALVLGPEPGRDDFIWSAGQGGYGFQTAPAASALVAALATGGTTDHPADLVAALSPARFR
ncbi:FAD-binding oxidoreductase [Aliishimia ponticola]|uniref:FAD-binding oxidoreductase n=1 Tax=Aliishimia ponticola TaxID=2499833 RepID=A0A4S4NC95_9RHOB|nr:FAD-dependent oxidoreductase [Aliishimia ponticola]THH36087.1 FAD-binding oxidoreductase [Aliishimia ponticola]